MNVRDMNAALTDVELDCAFALYYFGGKPWALVELDAGGVIQWARERHPEAFVALVDSVTTAIRETLQAFYPQQGDNPLAGADVGLTVDQMFDSLVLGRTDEPRPQLMATEGEWPLPAPESGVGFEQPNLNTPDGSGDFDTND